ncbi:MAG: rhodanese-like domain-containing protein [Polyangiales bacterium]
MERPDRITTEEVMRRLNGGEKLVFVDVRTDEQWSASEEMIGGATRVPPGAIEQYAARLPDELLVLYCASPHEATSETAARDLLGRGFRKVRVLQGGIEEWKRSRGYTTAKLAEPDRVPKHAAPKHQQTSVSQTGRTNVRASASVPREGVGVGGVVETPMGNRPSAHRKQPT